MSRPQGKRAGLKRIEEARVPKDPILIVCEGKDTEPNYFKSLKEFLRLSSVTVKFNKGKTDCLQVVEYAVELKTKRCNNVTRDDYWQVWCVFDIDVPPQPHLAEALALAATNGFNLALSNPCFEYWYILHDNRTSKQFQSSKECKSDFGKLLGDYSESHKKIFLKLQTETSEAIKNAKSLAIPNGWIGNIPNCNSSTNVYELVELLYKQANKTP